MTTITPDDYSVYCYYMGSDTYQLFINNVSADAGFVRIILGYTEMEHGRRVGHIERQWIISPLRPDTEHVYIDTITTHTIARRRVWLAFEAVEHGSKRHESVATLLALSPAPSKWRKKIGSLTDFNIRIVDSLKTVGELQNHRGLTESI